MSTALSSGPITSRWYGQGRAVDLARRLESLSSLPAAPGPAGVITARPDDVTVTFVEGLKAPLPQPWQPCGREARISWDAVATGSSPDPDHPVYLVVFGTTEDGALVGLNLAAFSRIRITGDRPTATAVIARWVLELLATHPDISIGLTRDAWSGPWTTRVQPVAPGQVPDVDVLVCGAELTYAERSQIVAAASSPIVLDLGDDAAVTTTWSITCGADREGLIRRGAAATPMSATLIVPGPDVVERCTQLMLAAPAAASPQPAPAWSIDSDDGDDGGDDIDTGPFAVAAGGHDDAGQLGEDAAIDFFSDPGPVAAGADLEQPDIAASEDDQLPWATDEPAAGNPIGDEPVAVAPPAADVEAAPQAPPAPVSPPPSLGDAGVAAGSGPAPVVAPIWNHILGRMALAPPHPGAEPGPRERRINELLVYLQLHRWASTDDIIRAVFNGAATDKTVTQQMSLLRTRLGAVHPGGRKACPPMSDGTYSIEPVVCSDWMEFDRLVEILVETTPTSHLIAAMDLVTGPALGGIPHKEWPWARDLREQMRDRVPGAAVVLARRHRDSDRFGIAVEAARKGLWYDKVRQDLWEVALSSALDGRDKETFRALRGQYLNSIPGPDRDAAVLDLTGRAG
jgi:hypothetical protein